MSIAMPAEDPRAVPNRAVIDPAVITHNTRQIVGSVSEQTAVMAVVKADAYGHGMLMTARAAIAGGATWLGVAHPASALALSSLKLDVPILAWLFEPHTAAQTLPQCISRSIDISVGSPAMLDQVITAARSQELRARIHLKIDTGMGRNGVLARDVAYLGSRIRQSEYVELVGAWTHLATADDPHDPMLDEQIANFDRALEDLRAEAGPVPIQHVANTAATLSRPDLHRDLVRVGIGLYGYPPVPTDLDLRPAMSVVSRLAAVKRVDAGQRIGYGHIHTTDQPTMLGLVPIGYADGLHRAASGRVNVMVREPAGDRLVPQVGRISMDQIVVDLGPDAQAREGDEVVLFGAPELPLPPAAQESRAAAPAHTAGNSDTSGSGASWEQPGSDDPASDAPPVGSEEQAVGVGTEEQAAGVGTEEQAASVGTEEQVASVGRTDAADTPEQASVLASEPVPALAPDGQRVIPPSAEDWARAAGTIPYEILTSVSVRVSRQVVGR